MKFVCDRCGKKYATAEDPSPGKVYKLKCKACGHLIVVKSMAGTSTAIPAVTEPVGASAGHPPEIELEIQPHPTPPPGALPAATQLAIPVFVPPSQAPELEAPPPPADFLAPPPLPGGAPLDASEPPLDGSGIKLEPLTTPVHPPPPPPDKDELADLAAAAREVIAAPPAAPEPRPAAAGYVDLFSDGGITAEKRLEPKPDDPFAAVARASLPESYPTTGAPDPVAPPRSEPERERTPARPPPAKPTFSAPPKRSGVPVALIGLGVVALVGITAVAVMRGGRSDSPPPPRPPAPVAQPPRAEPAPAPPKAQPEPTPEPPKPAPVARVEPPPEPPKVAKPERKPEPQRPPERKPERKPEPARVVTLAPAPERKPEPPPPPPPEPDEPRTETRDVQLSDGAATLTPEVIQKVINANKRAFASCISDAAKAEPDLKLDGRRVAVRLKVNANGAVVYPTLDDVTLNGTGLGDCLKKSARLMIFPKFKGDSVPVEVPLTLSTQ